MSLVDYISRNPYQPAERISKFEEEVLVATLSRIQTDAKLNQQVKPISASRLKKFYLDNKLDTPIHTTKQPNKNYQVLNIDSTTPVIFSQSILSLAPQHTTSKLPSIHNYNLISDRAMQLRILQSQSAFATPNYNPNFTSVSQTNFDSQHETRVHFTQNQLTPAQRSSN